MICPRCKENTKPIVKETKNKYGSDLIELLCRKCNYKYFEKYGEKHYE